MKWSILKYALFFNLVLLAACAAEPADGPGLCKLRCSDAIIAASDYKIESMTPDLSLKCIGTTDGTIQTARFTAKFRITRQRQSGSAVEEVGVPNVSITPTLYGLFDRSVDNEVQQGIYTDTSEFCSVTSKKKMPVMPIEKGFPNINPHPPYTLPSRASQPSAFLTKLALANRLQLVI